MISTNTKAVTFVTVTDFKDDDVWPWLVQWSTVTVENNGMLDRSANWFRENLIHAVFAFNENKELVASAGLFPALDKDGDKIMLDDGRLVVEMGSLFVAEEERKRGHARTCVDLRLKFIRSHNHFPVMVTRDVNMTQKILNGSASPIEDYLHLRDAGSKIRYCSCREEKKIFNHVCEFCPKAEKTVLVFKEFL